MTDSPRKVTHLVDLFRDLVGPAAMVCGLRATLSHALGFSRATAKGKAVTCPECRRWMEERCHGS